MEVSKSGFYWWRRMRATVKPDPDTCLTLHIKAIHAQHKGRYGSPRIHKALAHQGLRVGKKRVERLMREHGLVGRTRRRFVCTTRADARAKCAPNLLDRDFTASAPNQKCATDITYVETQEGFLYLAVIQDLFSSRVVGWAIDDNMEVDLCTRALQMALSNRKFPKGLMLHSDRGSQYTSSAYQRLLTTHQIHCSMSRRGQCWDNATAESFFGRLKEEVFPKLGWKTQINARREIAEYLDCYYNCARIKKSIGYLSPIEYELINVAPKCAA
jgi:putative transposase